MSRSRRHIVPGFIYHFIARFVASEFFIKSDVERRGYLSLLGDGLARCDWRCLSFAVMSNHVHLALLAGEDSLASWIRGTHSRFAEWINQRRERIGAVFTRGPKMIAVRPEGVATLLGYLHNNPVRAGVAQQPGDSGWTSHAMYRGDAKAYSWLDVDLGLRLAGFANGDSFDRWVSATPIERKQLDAMRVVPLRGPGRPRKQRPVEEGVVSGLGDAPKLRIDGPTAARIAANGVAASAHEGVNAVLAGFATGDTAASRHERVYNVGAAIAACDVARKVCEGSVVAAADSEAAEIAAPHIAVRAAQDRAAQDRAAQDRAAQDRRHRIVRHRTVRPRIARARVSRARWRIDEAAGATCACRAGPRRVARRVRVATSSRERPARTRSRSRPPSASPCGRCA